MRVLTELGLLVKQINTFSYLLKFFLSLAGGRLSNFPKFLIPTYMLYLLQQIKCLSCQLPWWLSFKSVVGYCGLHYSSIEIWVCYTLIQNLLFSLNFSSVPQWPCVFNIVSDILELIFSWLMICDNVPHYQVFMIESITDITILCKFSNTIWISSCKFCEQCNY